MRHLLCVSLKPELSAHHQFKQALQDLAKSPSPESAENSREPNRPRARRHRQPMAARGWEGRHGQPPALGLELGCGMVPGCSAHAHACQLEPQGRWGGLYVLHTDGPEASIPGLKYLMLPENESWPAGRLLGDEPASGPVTSTSSEMKTRTPAEALQPAQGHRALRVACVWVKKACEPFPCWVSSEGALLAHTDTAEDPGSRCGNASDTLRPHGSTGTPTGVGPAPRTPHQAEASSTPRTLELHVIKPKWGMKRTQAVGCAAGGCKGRGGHVRAVPSAPCTWASLLPPPSGLCSDVTSSEREPGPQAVATSPHRVSDST